MERAEVMWAIELTGAAMVAACVATLAHRVGILPGILATLAGGF